MRFFGSWSPLGYRGGYGWWLRSDLGRACLTGVVVGSVLGSLTASLVLLGAGRVGDVSARATERLESEGTAVTSGSATPAAVDPAERRRHVSLKRPFTMSPGVLDLDSRDRRWGLGLDLDDPRVDLHLDITGWSRPVNSRHGDFAEPVSGRGADRCANATVFLGNKIRMPGGSFCVRTDEGRWAIVRGWIKDEHLYVLGITVYEKRYP